MDFVNVTVLYIQSIHFRNCGWSLSRATFVFPNKMKLNKKICLLYSERGGAASRLHITSSTFDNSSGSLYYLGSLPISVTYFENSSFINNKLGLYIEAEEILFQNCNFENNAHGGVIIFGKDKSRSNLTVINTNFFHSNFFADISLQVYTDEDNYGPRGTCWSEVYINDCMFLNNAGGGIYVTPAFHCNTSIHLIDSVFLNNHAAVGGAFRMHALKPQPTQTSYAFPSYPSYFFDYPFLLPNFNFNSLFKPIKRILKMS